MIRWVFQMMIGGLISFSTVVAQTDPVSDSLDLLESSLLIIPEQDRPIEELELERNRMEAYRKNPIDINNCNRTDLEEFGILQPGLINALIRYRETMGGFVDVYELQAVPGMDVMVFQRLKTIITIRLKNNDPWKFEHRKQAKNSLEFRIGGGLKKTTGDWIWNREKNWQGGTWHHSLRYWCDVGKKIRLVLHGEKDVGEKFQFNHKTIGYDFLGGGLQINEWKGMSKLLIGDYLVQWGQGLIQWHGRPPGKQMDVTAIKAQATSPRLQTTNAEQGFHRGVVVNWKRYGLQCEGFFSYRKLDSRLENLNDSVGVVDGIIGLQESGLHRTSDEIYQKANLNLVTTGIRVCLRKPQYHLAFQSLVDRFNRKWVESDKPYMLFRIPKQIQLFSSIDYSLTYRNIHFFGETAWQVGGDIATVNGILWTVSNKISCSMLHRHLPNQFTSLHGQPFSESSYRQSEHGVYAGLQYKWNARTQFHVFADIHAFSWIQYRIHGLTEGRECGGSIINTRRKGLTWSVRASFQEIIVPVPKQAQSEIPEASTQMRTRINGQAGWPVSEHLQMHLSVGWQSTISIDQKIDEGSGMLINMEAKWKKATLPFSVHAQWILANTTDYESRMYTQTWSMAGQKTFMPFYGLGSQWNLGLGYRTMNGIRFQFRLTSRYNLPTTNTSSIQNMGSVRNCFLYFSAIYNW